MERDLAKHTYSGVCAGIDLGNKTARPRVCGKRTHQSEPANAIAPTAKIRAGTSQHNKEAVACRASQEQYLCRV